MGRAWIAFSRCYGEHEISDITDEVMIADITLQYACPFPKRPSLGGYFPKWRHAHDTRHAFRSPKGS